jgi:branched-chain amino acid transport system ATP-binding protein
LEIPVLLVEHDMGLVMEIADRVTVLDFGRVIADGTPIEMQSDPDVVRAYLGTGDDEPRIGVP